jgi:hypothetical protein
MKKVWLIVTMLGLVLSVPAALADTPLKSTNYQITESVLGAGGLSLQSSANYQTNGSVGDIAIGNSGANTTNPFQTNSGYTTTGDPALTFIVNTTSINFGALSNASTATQTATFSVIDYTSYGYNVIVLGSTPSYGSHNLANISTATTSSVGTEQFGMNLEANTSPTTFGANPSGGSANALAALGYNTANNYQYNSGDTIATSTSSSGQTNFTASYIANASATTPAGSYSGSLSFICVGSY